MTHPDASPLRQAARLREAGDLPGAVQSLAGIDAAADPQAGYIQLRYLFELQDYAGLQQATRRQLAALGAAGLPGGALPPATVQWLATLLRFAERCCLPPAEIAAALDATRPAALAAPELLLAWRAARRRQNYRDAMPTRFAGGVSLISLGTNCLPWHLPGRWGLRREEDFTALFGPFSLAGHRIPGMIAALEEDFATYCTPETLRIVTTTRGQDMAMRKDRAAHWNHNRGPYWLGQDAAPLRASMQAKAALFRAACRRPDAVFLLAGCQVEYPEEKLDFLPALDAALARFTGRGGNRILITNHTAHRPAAASLRVNASTTFAYSPFPSPDYVWHDDAVADSPAGQEFERSYMLTLIRSLLRWGVLQRLAAPAEA
ncbi:papain-like cysteine peptidase [Falsiroseomonas tokyonensis]|uniref:Papain-like cysteine peptidase n=1 Tax=Falsiroseomonas tokyonensis TaxID=430521 RepID=A0ABV7BZR4_9PROT|nr:papain-like cysteine peptidase [Falsiroseomonas tokyonensis]MBU8539923.1 hypothetical protein [Falsiroseomonas tokyonensis]